MKKTITIVLALAMLAFCFADALPRRLRRLPRLPKLPKHLLRRIRPLLRQQAAQTAPLQTVLSKGEFILGLDDSFPPYGYNDNGEIDRL